ncbi:GerAB/ArcD/ProY family transporter [Ureibacillus sp. 179-F W5.1 NHS]|uniref:Spore gernimation protein n=2 Tax=Bacillales TaxID=1385 RepID=A0A3M8HB80_9BACI|nr:GerAB/ArcD/ProY family transporter [Lysinibacillus halotolerans]RNC99330.1 spore gernimation protein [Lysinibacillus halotolerans]
MKKHLQIDPSQKFNASLLLFTTTAVQIGVGIHGFQSVIYKEAKQDAWISIIISFIAAHLVVFVMFKTLEMYGSDDIFGIQINVFGKYLGNLMNLVLISYCLLAFFVVIRTYTEVINVWVFPDLSTSFITITVLLIVIYTFSGGLRVIIGICFFSYVLPLWILAILLFPLEYANYNHVLPVFGSDLISILKGAYSMSFTIVGFEVLNVLYPFVKEQNKAKKYVHLGLLSTLAIYLFVMLISLSFFSGEQLEKYIWATLTMFSIIRLPFIERIELFTICFWLIIILPNLCLYAWSAHRGFIRMIKVSEKKFIYIFSIIIFIGTLFVESRSQIKTINDFFGRLSFVLVFIYPFILNAIANIKRLFSKLKKKKVENREVESENAE